VSSPWARATPERAKVGGGFMTLINKGSQDDRLTGAASEVSGSVEIHEMHLVNGVMMMRHLNPGIPIKAGSSVTLKPFSHHLMFMDLKQPLVARQSIKVTLLFEKAGSVEIDYEVLPIGAKGPAQAQGDKH
jgi:copper(I)-binding protein